jgi:hypothetical protein
MKALLAEEHLFPSHHMQQKLKGRGQVPSKTDFPEWNNSVYSDSPLFMNFSFSIMAWAIHSDLGCSKNTEKGNK